MKANGLGVLKVSASLALIALIATGCVVRRTQEERSDVMDLENSAAPSEPAPALEPLTTSTPPAVAETAQPEPAAGPRTHTIAAGDTLWNLAVKYYGDGKQSKRIQDANPGIEPTRMSIGKQIVIP